jgi:hypothetical protein
MRLPCISFLYVHLIPPLSTHAHVFSSPFSLTSLPLYSHAHLLSFFNPPVCPLPFSHTCACPLSLPRVFFISHALYFMLICPLVFDMGPLFLPHICASWIYILERPPHCSGSTFFSSNSLSLFHYSFFFLASSLCIRNNTLLIFVLVFSGAINPLAREIMKFWFAGIKLSDLVGIVIVFYDLLGSSLLWGCFSLVITPLSLSFHSLKN